MLNYKINGKDFSKGDVNLLICYDSIKDFTEVKMYTDHGEIQVDDSNSDIEINVNIVSGKINTHSGISRGRGERINKLERIIAVLREEILELKNN
ncbi:MAG: hypothetical protein WBK46_14160 [Ruminococcus flavefaciens]